MDYERLAADYQQISDQHQKTAGQLSLARGVAFIISVISIICYFQYENNYWLGISCAGVGLFIWLISLHQKQSNYAEHYAMLSLINLEENKRKQLKLHDFESGEKYLTPDHPYAADLDVFGQHSLFQLINRTALPDSEKLLANWLSQKSQKEEIESRQESIKDLIKKPEWIQNLQSVIRIEINKKKKKAPAVSANDLFNWAQEKETQNSKAIILCAIVSNVITISTAILIYTSDLSLNWFYGILGLNGLLLTWIAKKLSSQSKGIDKALYLILSYQKAIKHIVNESFKSHELKSIHDQLIKYRAIQSIDELAKITQRIDSRSNMLYAILDVIFLPDAYLSYAISKWKSQHGNDIELWLNCVHQVESLASISGFAISNPDYVFPSITEAKKIFGSAIGHPLINTQNRVSNDYKIENLGHLDIITGSNMSGKSTFQRTLGLNLVLAYCGAPVCADTFETGEFLVFTSMRTKDNLEENTSSFYAELKRIKQLLDLTKTQESVFFLLDEILKGTNSDDRHKGAIALANQLTQSNAIGLISTHDLLLGKETANNPLIRNYSFNSEIDGNKIVFDYKLTLGICKSFNASQLMKNMGILS